MTRIDQFSDDCGTYEACGACDKNTHIPFLLIVCDSVDRDEAFTRLASRVEALAVINRHSRIEAGRSSILINSCSQSSAESAACSDPNNFVTALKNADSSCSAIVARSAQPELEFFDGLLGASGVIFLTSLECGKRGPYREPLLTGRRVPNKTESVSESIDKITGDCLRLQIF